MCNNCYHNTGRNRKSWNCEHTDSLLYAHGLCQSCYLNKYSKKRKVLKLKIKKNIKLDSESFSE